MKTKIYHDYKSCNKCGSVNATIEATSITDYIICECKTVCGSCGHEDYWAYGFYESSQHIENRCKKY